MRRVPGLACPAKIGDCPRIGLRRWDNRASSSETGTVPLALCYRSRSFLLSEVPFRAGESNAARLQPPLSAVWCRRIEPGGIVVLGTRDASRTREQATGVRIKAPANGLWTQNTSLGRSLDANLHRFASKNKSFQINGLSGCNASFGRFGRKIPEHFIEEGARGRTHARRPANRLSSAL